MYLSHSEPGPRFHEMQAREKARLARLAARNPERARMHLKAVESLGAEDSRAESALRSETNRAVSEFTRSGGLKSVRKASVMSGTVIEYRPALPPFSVDPRNGRPHLCDLARGYFVDDPIELVGVDKAPCPLCKKVHITNQLPCRLETYKGKE